jgi:acyl-CoA reductase-like NAD-dependent aldehyde dehydrogenase
VIKPSEHAPVSTLGFAELIAEAGFPAGVVNVVTSNSRETGAALAAHPGVDKVAFTGSTATGRAVARAAADNLTKVTLELGGKSPQVVFADADLEAAANGIVAGVFAAAGQTCMAGSRLIVHADVHDELVRLVAARASAIKLGDPNSADTEMGPVANEPQYRKVLGYLDTARAEGATVACGGVADSGLGGLFVQPTVLTGITPESTVYREEVFGPVLAALTFTDEDEAVKLANDTPYGLAGAVWTKDIHRAHRVAARIKAGSVWINAYRVVAPSVPFGGFRQSGLGRENGIHAIDEYLEEKAIWVELTGGTRDPFTLG